MLIICLLSTDSTCLTNLNIVLSRRLSSNLVMNLVLCISTWVDIPMDVSPEYRFTFSDNHHCLFMRNIRIS